MDWGGNPSAPHVSRPDVSASEGGWFWLLAAFVGVVLALAFWKLRALARQTALADAESGWKLGPWPVNPSTVRTREDVVRAFEYLALLCLGPGARQHHHHDLARKLGSTEAALRISDHPAMLLRLPDRRRAARELADLYEQARYAPPSDPWSEAAIAAARRDLCSLAWVAAV
jgi:hypothetical protein